MACRATLALGLIAVTYGLASSVPSLAQSPTVPRSCASPAVTSEELHTNAHANVQKATRKDDSYRKVIVDRIDFDQPVHLSTSDAEEIVKTANEMEWDANSSGWVDQLAEVGLRGAWQDRGYFEIVETAHARSVGGDSGHERFVVSVHVEKEGPQFHLGTLRFTGTTGSSAVPEADLRQVFPMREGEIFSVGQVRAGIQALTKLYGSKGYIDFIAVPNTKIDENLQRIDLVMYLDEQTQFRIGNVEIRGFSPSLEARLRSVITPGEVFNPENLQAFFNEYRASLPSHDLENFEVRRNFKAGIVDLTFGPPSCL